MQTTLNRSGAALLEENISFIHDKPVNPTLIYILSNPYSARRVNGKWHLNNIYNLPPRKKVLTLLFS